MTLSSKKVGGLRFVRIGRLSISFCITRKPAPAYEPRLRSIATGLGFRAFITA